MPKFYAVARGRNPGIYDTWEECKKQINGFSSAAFKKFNTEEEARQFIDDHKAKVPNFKAKKTDKGLKRKLEESSDCTTSEIDAVADGPVVYTDGACSNNGRRGAVAGIGVYWGAEHRDNLSLPLTGRPTNNRAEIHAAIFAIKQAKDKCFNKLTIRTDSNFLCTSVYQYIPKWRKNGWKLVNGSTVKNKEDFEELVEAMEGIQVKFEHVPGHRGIVGNEEADRLANEGMRKRKKME